MLVGGWEGEMGSISWIYQSYYKDIIQNIGEMKVLPTKRTNNENTIYIYIYIIVGVHSFIISLHG